MEFNKKNILELREMAVEELSKYYMEKRKCEYDFTIEEIINTTYRDKNKVSYDEVFSFIKRLK